MNLFLKFEKIITCSRALAYLKKVVIDYRSIVGFLFIIIIFISRSSVPQGPIDHQVRSMKAGEAVDYMKMGLVKEVRRNGAVVHVKEEGEDKEQRFFIPGKASKILLTKSKTDAICNK